MNVRYWLTFLVMIHVNFLFAQFHGDVNRDGVIDATDYYSLKQFLITGNPTNSCDINNDGLYNVADIVVLENYLFREGKSSFESKKIKESDNILVFPGKIDVGESYIDIVVSEIEGLSAFEFNLEGVDSIQEIIGGEALKNRAIVFRGNKLICTPGPNKFERLVSKNIIRIKFFSNSHLDDLQICISEPVFTNIEAEMLNVQIGECANKYYAISGLTDLKEKVIGSRNKDFESDINKDGFTNVVDVYQVEEFLYSNGEIPGYIMEEGAKLKLFVEAVDLEKKDISFKVNSKNGISSFQFGINGLEGIEIIPSVGVEDYLQLRTNKNYVYGFLDQGNPFVVNDDSFLKLTFDTIVEDELCIISPLFIDVEGNLMETKSGSCYTLKKEISGCMDPKSINYDPLATKDNGSCKYDDKKVVEKNDKEQQESIRNKEDDSDKGSKKVKERSNTKKQKVNKLSNIKKDREDVKERKERDTQKNKIEKKEKVKEDIFELSEIKEGYFIPQVDSEQRSKLKNPENGLLLFDVDLNSFMVYDGKQWSVIKLANPGVMELFNKRKRQHGKN